MENQDYVMPSPTTSLATLRPDLATFLEFDLESEKNGYVAAQVLPVVDVASQAGVFGKIPLEQLLQQRNTARTPRSGYNRSNFTFTSATYACLENGVEEVVDDREAKMYREYFDAEQISTMRAFSAVLRGAEQRAADLLFNTTTWDSGNGDLFTGITHEWDDPSNAVPVTDVEAAVQKVYDNSGLWCNALIINKKVFRNLRTLNQIRDRIESSGAGYPSRAQDITVEMLKAVFDLDYIIVAGTSKNGATEGQAASPEQIWSDEYAMVCRIATSGDMSEPCVGRTFHWAEDGSSIGGTVESYRDEHVRGNVIRVRHDTDELVLYPEAGHLLGNITT
jgi:hypothetical protein